MATITVVPTVEAPYEPSVVQSAGVQVVRMLTTRDNPLVTGISAGITLRPHFNARADAEEARIVAYYKSLA